MAVLQQGAQILTEITTNPYGGRGRDAHIKTNPYGGIRRRGGMVATLKIPKKKSKAQELTYLDSHQAFDLTSSLFRQGGNLHDAHTLMKVKKE